VQKKDVIVFVSLMAILVLSIGGILVWAWTNTNGGGWYMPIKHKNLVAVGTPDNITNHWNADHATSGGSVAYGLVWKDASQNALNVLNQGATVDWTVLDLTAYTSANARMAYLQLTLVVDTATKDYYLGVRKNGTTPGQFPLVRVNQGNANAADIFMGYVIVGLDTNQVIQYRIDVEAGGQCDIQIDVLGYWE
jgi:hypothetical protein